MFLKLYEFVIMDFLAREDIMKRLSLAFLVVLISVVALVSASTTALAARGNPRTVLRYATTDMDEYS